MYRHFTVFYLLFCTAWLLSCASGYNIERTLPIMGHWRTEKGIELSIHQTPNHGIAAVITSPGEYYGNEIFPGNKIITHIEPLVDGGFRGNFLIPGKSKPVKVMMKLKEDETLVITTWDIREMGSVMRWSRTK